jgi:hypothetical protein
MATEKQAYWKQALAQARTELETFLQSLNPAELQTPVVSEDQNTWTVLDVVAHLLENERGMSIHIHKIRKGQETVPPDFDLNRWNAGLKERMSNPTLSELLENLAQVRARTLKELDSLAAEEWALQGRHPARGMITIEQYYETIAYHDRHHLNDIQQALSRKSHAPAAG